MKQTKEWLTIQRSRNDTELVQQLPLDVWTRAWMKMMMGLWEIQNLFLLSFHLMGVSLAHSQLWVNWHPIRQPNYSSVFTITVTSTDDCCLSPLHVQVQDLAVQNCRELIQSKSNLNNFQLLQL